ncbi:GNAT family N-acetyltransferase [Deinococcus puniceus]|uniref:N-acetyltransferase domain-containing protein n=1 Tax=Deinococcus puniceus TaxID=1182568 RepID=A0A172TAJ9_9DEIO|nr:GNAT family N-acetyltransferase [Deinococcus puniceus]ANE43974.1 hypothetical protein SU48_09505 [Deinococcus puniceus]
MLTLASITTANLEEYLSVKKMDAAPSDLFRGRFERGEVAAESAKLLSRDGQCIGGYSIANAGQKKIVFVHINDVLSTLEEAEVLTELASGVGDKAAALIIINKSNSAHAFAADSPFISVQSHSFHHLTPLDRPLPQPEAFEPVGIEILSTQEVAEFLIHSDGEFTVEGQLDYYESCSTVGGLLQRVNGVIVALGMVCEPRPGMASIQMIGVHRDYRRQGRGSALQLALMHRAKAFADVYAGATHTDNAAMLRVMQKNGCQISDEQWVYTFR